MRPKRQRALERLREAEKGLEDALARLAAVQTYNDMCEVLDSTDVGRKQCTRCAYMNVREREELEGMAERAGRQAEAPRPHREAPVAIAGTDPGSPRLRAVETTWSPL